MYHHHHQVQTTTLAKEMLDPTQTVVNTRRLNLSHFDVFPVVFKLCIQPGFNQTAVVEAGYSEVGGMESKTNVNILTPIHELMFCDSRFTSCSQNGDISDLDLNDLPERLRTTSWEEVASTGIGLVGQVTHKKAALSAMFQVLFQNLALLKYFDLNQFDGKKTVIFLFVEKKS